ncbi:MAG: hypothetical protein IJN54_06175 [Lachnospiraceae bacterium]|nr:hypothetical protein [Lachnospiraceae bacterium]
MKDEEYLDRIILALRAKYQQKKAENEPIGEEMLVGVRKVSLYREVLFEGKCSIMLPETMRDMSYLDSTVKYRSQNRPQVIKTDSSGDASITFNLLPMSDTETVENILVTLEQIRSDMKKVWKQNVFYDMGEIVKGELPVAWMDFRAFCLDGSLYSMIFIFRMEEQLVLGNFHCSFPQYDIWKPVILKLLTTIRAGV